jgi:hypothetical protein
MVNTRLGQQRYHRCMSEYPPGGPFAAQGPGGSPAAPAGFPGATTDSTSWPYSSRRPSRWPTFLAIAIALIASGIAIAGWFRPPQSPAASPPTRSTFTEQQISDAKGRTCKALDTVNKGVTQHAGTNAPEHSSNDPAMAEAQAADSRLAIIAGGWYLRDHLDPATPAAVATSIRHLSEILLDLGANYLAGAKNADPDQSALITEGNTAFDQALELCK